VELSRFVSALPHPVHRSPNDLHAFEALARELNEATNRYLRAIGGFNAACKKGGAPRYQN
jgi:hypothetical protein